MSVATDRLLPATDGRRFTAVVLDALLALVCGLAAGVAAVAAGDRADFLGSQGRAFWLSALAGAVAASFVNQVLLSYAVRASIGKLLTGLRVVRAGDGGRAGFGRTVGRWGAGFYWGLVIVPLHAAANSDVQQADLVGLRVVRRPTSR